MTISDASFSAMLNAIKKTNIFQTKNIPVTKANGNSTSTQSLFAQNDEAEETKTTSTQSMADMSSSDFIKYVYNNYQSLSSSVSVQEDGSSEKSGNSKDVLKSRKEDGVELPRLVRYKAQVVLATGKTLDEVVAAIKKKSPASSESAIKAELQQKYSAKSGGNLNMNA